MWDAERSNQEALAVDHFACCQGFSRTGTHACLICFGETVPDRQECLYY